MRRLAAVAAMAIALGGAGCSKQDPWCEKVKTTQQLMKEAGKAAAASFDTIGPSTTDPIAGAVDNMRADALAKSARDQLEKASDEMQATAPPEVKGDIALSLAGNDEAQARATAYVKDHCGIDLDAKS